MTTRDSAKVIDPIAMRNLFIYNESSPSCLIWRERDASMFESEIIAKIWSAKFKNKNAGNLRPDKAWAISIGPIRYLAHRIVYSIYHNITIDTLSVDHIDGNRSNNKISNLRLASHSENCKNVKSHSDGSSKFLGVSWNKRKGKWHASIYYNGKGKSLGYFNDEIDAHKARVRAEIELHGRFSSHLSRSV